VFIKKYINSTFGIREILDYLDKKQTNKTGILKLDIEGSEYDILDMIIEHKNLFNTIVIEFHNVKSNVEVLKNFVSKLNFYIVNVSINEVGLTQEMFPNLLEITFINEKILHSNFIGQKRNNEKGNDLYVLEFL
jgi:hypothetical protein